MAIMERSVINKWSGRALRRQHMRRDRRLWGSKLCGFEGKDFQVEGTASAQMEEGNWETCMWGTPAWQCGWKRRTEGRRRGLRGRWRPSCCSLVGCCWDSGISPELNEVESLEWRCDIIWLKFSKGSIGFMLRADCSGPGWRQWGGHLNNPVKRENAGLD